MATKVQVLDAQAPGKRDVRVLRVGDHSVEVVSDSGEGAQTCGQIFGSVSAKMGNGVWTVEIIPAEIEPPARTPAGASGISIRLGNGPITNWGDETRLVVAFNEQVLLARHRLGALADDATILLEGKWASDEDPAIREAWSEAMDELSQNSYRIIHVPYEEQTLTVVENARRGKNMFALGILCWIYHRDLDRVRAQIKDKFRKKSEEVYANSEALLDLGYAWAEENLDERVDVPVRPTADAPSVVMNGNEAFAFGAIAAGFELVAMYPITPASSVSHQLGEIFGKYGGMVHQAEDEIAAAGVTLGASYGGRAALTITSGPGLALKTEFLGLTVMTEIPMVLINVQRGGPSTGLPTKVEQSDLLAAIYGQPGDAPHFVIAPATIEECFHVMATARLLAETFRTLVIILSDANLATGVAPFSRPELSSQWQASPPDLRPVPEGAGPYDWDPDTGLSRRIVPGQLGGEHTVTGLAHDEGSKVAYGSENNQHSHTMRSRKIAAFQSTLLPPPIHGDDSGDLLLVGWGSTKGAIEEAVDRARAEGTSVSSTHLRFLSPLEPGLKEMFGRFRKVLTVEINYSDEPDHPYINEQNRRRGQLSLLLRSATLVDIDCWTRVIGEPLRPRRILDVIKRQLATGGSQ